MAFLHSLVQIHKEGRAGWCAPVELGEATPEYIAFVLPTPKRPGFHDAYDCEIIRILGGRRFVETVQLNRNGEDTFALELPEGRVWFAAKPMRGLKRRFPYLGRFNHADFGSDLAEIEPVDPGQLDALFLRSQITVIGCEAAHYQIEPRPRTSRSPSVRSS